MTRVWEGDDPPIPSALVRPRTGAGVPHRGRFNGQAVAYTYFRRDENEARQTSVLTHDEARRIASNIAKLPEFLSRKGEE